MSEDKTILGIQNDGDLGADTEGPVLGPSDRTIMPMQRPDLPELQPRATSSDATIMLPNAEPPAPVAPARVQTQPMGGRVPSPSQAPRPHTPSGGTPVRQTPAQGTPVVRTHPRTAPPSAPPPARTQTPRNVAPPPANGTPPPMATVQQSPRSRRSSEAPSVGPSAGPSVAPSVGGSGARSAWDAHAGTNAGTGNDTGPTGVHSASAAPHPGVRINQYELIKILGEGGMGTVYLARDLRLGRRVAIKFLQSNQAELTQRFLVEARATARCQHDNIVVIYEVGEHNGSPYMVLEFLNGKPLTHYLKNGQKLPYTRAVEVLTQVLKALECSHEQGIVHRDLKPDNIFIMDSGTIKVLDFGIAKVLEPTAPQAAAVPTSQAAVRIPSPLELATGSNTGLTRHGTIMGTLKYMSPEQWGIGVEIDHLSDVWACGVLLHRMICGRHPLHPLDGNQLVVTAMLELPMPSMTEAAPPDCPRELIQIVDRCLMKVKEQRWQSVSELLAALQPYLPGRRTSEIHIDEMPYAGLSSFQESDAGKFFGRNREVAAMVTRIRDRPIMAVVGSSGVGKSSFVRAGLVPALKRSGENWETIVVRPGRKPLEALASVMQPMVATAANLADDLEEQRKLSERLKKEPGLLGHMLRGRARRDTKRIMLFVDQFEELYTQVADPEERAAFTACLSAVADDATSPLRVVLSIRADFLERTAEDQQFLGELMQGLFFLGPPNREGLRDAIIQPAELAGFTFELSATIDDMLDHLETTPGALPLLQFAAAKLWENRDKQKKQLTHGAYTQMGGVAGALASHADRVIQDLGPQANALCRAILLRLVSPERTRAIVPINELRELSREVGEVQRLVDHMVDARLLVVQTLDGGKGSTVEIVHESLINSWPTLRRWLDENQDDAALVDQLRTAARQWAAKGRDDGLLWRGEMADEAKKFRKRYKGPLSDVERGFIEEVITFEAASARRKRALVIGGFTGLSLLVVGTMIALLVIHKSRNDAQLARVKAEQQTQIAVQKEKEANDNLEEVKRKELERQKAENERQKSEAEKLRVETEKLVVDEKLDESQEDLRDSYEKLKQALARAKVSQRRAEENERRAEKAEGEALAAKDEALEQKNQAEFLYKQEQDRRKRLENQIGSTIVDELK